MTRRRSRLRHMAAPLAGALLLVMAAGSGCFGSRGEGGAATVHWDRDVDEECGMVVSDKRFAAQAIDPNGRAHTFDDAGCMLAWLDKQPWQTEAKLWIRDRNADRWIAPQGAHWRAGEKTPSAYGFGASAEPAYGPLTFDQVRQQVRDAKAPHEGKAAARPSERSKR